MELWDQDGHRLSTSNVNSVGPHTYKIDPNASKDPQNEPSKDEKIRNIGKSKRRGLCLHVAMMLLMTGCAASLLFVVWQLSYKASSDNLTNMSNLLQLSSLNRIMDSLQATLDVGTVTMRNLEAAFINTLVWNGTTDDITDFNAIAQFMRTVGLTSMTYVGCAYIVLENGIAYGILDPPSMSGRSFGANNYVEWFQMSETNRSTSLVYNAHLITKQGVVQPTTFPSGFVDFRTGNNYNLAMQLAPGQFGSYIERASLLPIPVSMTMMPIYSHPNATKPIGVLGTLLGLQPQNELFQSILTAVLPNTDNCTDCIIYVMESTGQLVLSSKGPTSVGVPGNYTSLFVWESPIRPIAVSGARLLAQHPERFPDRYVESLDELSVDGVDYLVGAEHKPAGEQSLCVIIMIPRSAMFGGIDSAQATVNLTVLLLGITLVILGLIIMFSISRHLAREAKAKFEAIELSEQYKHATMKAEAASQAKSLFLANMSHEIRTPMTGIVGTVQLLQDEDSADDRRQLLQVVDNCSKSLMQVLNDILDISKVEAGKLLLDHAKLNLRDELESTVEIFGSRALEQNIELYMEYCLASEEYFGDATRIRQILNNLLSNAIKFTVKGSVRVRILDGIEVNLADKSSQVSMPMPVHLSYNELPSVKRSTQVTGRCKKILICVTDTGCGISEVNLKKMCNVFVQADGASTTQQFGGHGLGLSIVRHLVGLMRGTIEITSQVGVGTTFCATVYLETIPDLTTASAVQRPSACHLPAVDSEASTERLIPAPNGSLRSRSKHPTQRAASHLPTDERSAQSAQSKLANAVDLNDASSTYSQTGIPAFLIDHYAYVPEPALVGSRVLLSSGGAVANAALAAFFMRVGFKVDVADTVEAFEICVAGQQMHGPYAFVLLANELSHEHLNRSMFSEHSVLLWAVNAGLLSAAKTSLLASSQFDDCVKRPLNARKVCKRLAAYAQRSPGSKARKHARTKFHTGVPSTMLLGRPVKILLVDDVATNRFVIAAQLKKALPCDITTASNGVEAVHISAQQKFDVILMDCQMPEMDGFEATRLIRRQCPFNQDSQILALTANAMAEDRQLCEDAGMNQYLTKPVMTAKLLSMLTLVLKHGAVASPPRNHAKASLLETTPKPVSDLELPDECELITSWV